MGGGVLKITFLAEKMMDNDDKPPVHLFFVMFRGSNLAKPWPSYCCLRKGFEFPGVSWQVGPFPSWFEPLKDGGSRTTGARRCRLRGGGVEPASLLRIWNPHPKTHPQPELGRPQKIHGKSCWNLYARDRSEVSRLFLGLCFLMVSSGGPIIYSPWKTNI